MSSEQAPQSPTAQGLDPKALAYSLSLPHDRRLYRYDIACSLAHIRMLARQGIVPAHEAQAIARALEDIRAEMESGAFPFRDELEDIHLNIEARLYEKVGEAAGHLHTARSRNDLIATDLRLFVMDACRQAAAAVRRLQRAIVDQAEAHLDAVMPGYTHLQRAQPVLLSHHLMAYFWMLERDRGRLLDCRERADELPLGSGALAGVPYPIDREFLARELGFSRISANSVDAVSSRDFVVEFIAAAATCLVHLSRLAEEIVLWAGPEYGFVELPPQFATGSSIMPQKRNPDLAELARAKAARVSGHMAAMLALMKGLPLAYNRDLQEDKVPLFESADALLATLDVFADMLPALRFRRERMEAAAADPFLLATDLADYLVRKGVPFRRAYQAVRELVAYAQAQGRGLRDLSLEEYRRFSPHFAEDALTLDARGAIEARDAPGGTATRRVREAIAMARKLMEEKA
ncbi:Argininosuccinate lyase [bacterium HR24]|jgi:argininosuccinate lyase|nr:Argininosuccinate lyase [bacterium HR24]